MLAANNNENERHSNRTNKQIIIIVCIYIILTVSNRFSSKSNESDETLKIKIQTKTNIQMSTIISQISKEKLQGNWELSVEAGQPILSKFNGKFQMLIVRYTEGEEKVSLDVRIKNGQYADDGVMQFRITQLSTNWKIEPADNKITARLYQNQTQIKTSYISQRIFETVDRGQLSFSNIQIEYEIKNETLTKTLILYSNNQKIRFDLKRQRYNMSGTILFALILFLIAYSQFSACLEIIRKFIEGEDNPSHYSFVTFQLAMMWDAALCLTAFIQAFKNQENIVLFIVPAFILCLLFTNLELRIMITVFQAFTGTTDLRQVICRFNIISYGGIIAMYPIMIYTNMGTSLFLIFSLIFLPQIYTNAVTGRRPNPNSHFYNQFLLFRFLIVLYLKCFPYNIFQLRPDYVLGFGCLLLVACQFGLLWVQKIYGPKKVLPKFLLPSVYNYEWNEQAQQAPPASGQTMHEECAICLQLLKKNPEQNDMNYEGIAKIMKTPCNHKYHGYCLVRWMTMKMQCPQCRTKLPPYQ